MSTYGAGMDVHKQRITARRMTSAPTARIDGGPEAEGKPGAGRARPEPSCACGAPTVDERQRHETSSTRTVCGRSAAKGNRSTVVVVVCGSAPLHLTWGALRKGSTIPSG